MKKIAVIGGSGMVASRFIDLSSDRLDLTSLDEKTLDITAEIRNNNTKGSKVQSNSRTISSGFCEVLNR